ncbi:MAG: hypothetical protein AABX98_00300 [Nanoarchaeota archaeon]
MDAKTKNKLRAIFNKHDPIKIYFGKKVNFDEYDPEIHLLPQAFRGSKNRKEFKEEVHKIFIGMFSKEIAGSRLRYEILAREVYCFLKAEKEFTKCKVLFV